MNTYQKKINKLTKQYISKEVEDYKNNFDNIICSRQNGKTARQMMSMIKLLKEMSILMSKAHYRQVRKNIREEFDKN